MERIACLADNHSFSYVDGTQRLCLRNTPDDGIHFSVPYAVAIYCDALRFVREAHIKRTERAKHGNASVCADKGLAVCYGCHVLVIL